MTTTQRERVTAHLIADGHLDESGIGRKPRPATCRACRLAVTAAITDLGITVACWPTPTTAYGELLAVMAGLPTWSEHPDDGLYHRGPVRIAGNNTHRVRVLVTHRCGDPPPEAHPAWRAEVRLQPFQVPGSPPPY